MSITETMRNIEALFKKHESEAGVCTALNRIGLTKEQVRNQPGIGLREHSREGRQAGRPRRSRNGARDKTVIELLARSRGNLSAYQIAKKLGINESSTRLALRRLVARGKIDAVPRSEGSKWKAYRLARRAKS